MEKKQTIKEILRFGMVGVFATILHYAVYWILQHFINVNVVSFISNFYLTSYFTFQTKPSWGKLIGMSGAHLVNYLLHMILLNIALGFGLSKTWAPIPVFAIVIPINFLLVRFVFKNKQL